MVNLERIGRKNYALKLSIHYQKLKDLRFFFNYLEQENVTH